MRYWRVLIKLTLFILLVYSWGFNFSYSLGLIRAKSEFLNQNMANLEDVAINHDRLVDRYNGQPLMPYFPIIISFVPEFKLKGPLNQSSSNLQVPCIGIISKDKNDPVNTVHLTTASACLQPMYSDARGKPLKSSIAIRITNIIQSDNEDLYANETWKLVFTNSSTLNTYKNLVTDLRGVYLTHNEDIIEPTINNLVPESLLQYYAGTQTNGLVGCGTYPLYIFGSVHVPNTQYYYITGIRYYGGWVIYKQSINSISHLITASKLLPYELKPSTSGSSVYFASKDGDLGSVIIIDANLDNRDIPMNKIQTVTPKVLGINVGVDSQTNDGTDIILGDLDENYNHCDNLLLLNKKAKKNCMIF